jgi:hypothetical protein
MGLKDKLEIGLKPDAPYRPDNLPDFQKNDPSCEVAGEPGESRRLRRARNDCDQPVAASPRKRAAGATRTAKARPAKARAAKPRRRRA